MSRGLHGGWRWLVGACALGGALSAPGQTLVGGTLGANTLWTTNGSPYILTGSLTVPSAITLGIGTGVEVRVPQGLEIMVYGTLDALGSLEHPVKFTKLPEAITGGRLLIWGSGYSKMARATLDHCIIKQMGSPSVRAVQGKYAEVNIRNSVFTNINATAIHMEQCRVDISHNRMNDTRETINLVSGAGVIASNRISQVNTYADGIDIDGYWSGPGDPTILIEGNIIIGGTDPNADGIDFGNARHVVFRNNIVMDFADKGISIGEGSQVVGYNNLISGCNMGVAIKSGSSPLLSNFTIVNCASGIRCYRDFSSLPLGSITNAIVWNCPTPIYMESDTRTTVGYTLIPGDTPWPGEGNLAGDALFMNPAAGDFRPRIESPAINRGVYLPWMDTYGDLDGHPRIAGSAVDLGVYEFPGGPAAFVLSPIASPQAMHSPVPVTVTALDRAANTDTAFTGRVRFQAIQSPPPPSTNAPSVLITEWVPSLEIQNVGSNAVHVSRWKLYLSGDTNDINVVLDTVVNGPPRITLEPGEVRASFFDASYLTILAPVFAGRHWILLLDENNQARDFVAVEWPESDIAAMTVTINSNTYHGADLFQGSGLFGEREGSVQRRGRHDTDRASDYHWNTNTSFGASNSELEWPFEIYIPPDQPLPVWPEWSDDFVAGAWHGFITINDTATVAHVSADNPFAFALSNPFEVRDFPRLTLDLPARVLESDGILTNAWLIANPAPTNALTVSLAPLPPGTLDLPIQMEIPAGSATNALPVSVIDDDGVNGPRTIGIHATAEGWGAAFATLDVWDDETPLLAFDAPDHVLEGAGALEGVQLTLDAVPLSAIVVALHSSAPELIAVPDTVTFPAGVTNVPFTLWVGDDQSLLSHRPVTLTASVPGWPPSTTVIAFLDQDGRQIVLSLPPVLYRDFGAALFEGTVTLAGTLPDDVEIALHSDRPDLLELSPAVTIPAGSVRAAFDLGLRPPFPAVMPSQVVVFAQAPDFIDAADAVPLRDADPDLVLHLAFDRDDGATARDYSPNAHTVTVYGAIWSPEGVAGGAMSFNGTSTYLSTISTEALMRNGQYSVSLWFAPTNGQAAGSQYLYGARRTPAPENRDYLRLSSAAETPPGQLETGPIVQGVSIPFETGAVMPVGPSGWRHVVTVIDAPSGLTHCYLDGEPVPASPREHGPVDFSAYANPLKLNIGSLNLNGIPQANTYFGGRIDDFRIYRRVLRSDEARALFTTGPLTDRDLDGLPDAWEWAMFGSLARDGGADFDGDGMSDRGEWIAGTDPTNPEDVLRVIGTYGGTSDPPFLFGWPSVSDRLYSVYTATNLSEPWQPAMHPPYADMPGSGGPMSYTSAVPIATGTYFTIGVRTNPAASD